MPTPNSVFYGQISDLIVDYVGDVIDATAFQTQMAALLPDWDGTIEQAARRAIEAIQRVNGLLDSVVDRDSDLSAWAAGTANGGPTSNGIYPIRIGDAVTVYLPSPAKLQEDMLKGDKGDDAKVDVVFSASFALGAHEMLPIFRAASAMAFAPSDCVGFADSPPVASAVFTWTKQVNGLGAQTAWGTATFAPGSHVPTFSIPVPTLAAGDVLRCFAPTIQDVSLADISLTLAGMT